MSENHRRISLPGQVQVRLAIHESPSASPALVILQSGDGVNCHQFGGLTKVEHVAAQLLAGILSRAQPSVDCENNTPSRDDVVRQAVETAHALLAACERKTDAPAETP